MIDFDRLGSKWRRLDGEPKVFFIANGGGVSEVFEHGLGTKEVCVYFWDRSGRGDFGYGAMPRDADSITVSAVPEFGRETIEPGLRVLVMSYAYIMRL